MILLGALLGVQSPLPIDADLLKGLPRETAVLTAHGKTSTCEGVSLFALLMRPYEPGKDKLKGDDLLIVVAMRGRDGYAIPFTIGELDPDLGAKKVIIADRCDGKPLSAEDGPHRLVVPGERRAARSVRQLATLELSPVSPPP